MKFKTEVLFSILILFIIVSVKAQSAEPDSSIDGTYQLLNPERSPKGGTTQEMLLQFAERNGTKMLVTAACSNCTPAVYTYQPEPSKALGLSVFFNSFGIYMIQYDENSFVSAIPDKALGKGVISKLSYSNFYSKDKSKVDGLDSSKIAEYVIGKSKKLME